VLEQYLLDWSIDDCLRQEKDEWLVRALKGAWGCQASGSLASYANRTLRCHVPLQPSLFLDTTIY
jgi:hypothetical protein